MKKILPVFWALMMVLSTAVTAQQYFLTGGTTSNIFPFSTTSSNQVQWLYYPSQFGSPSGTITTIYLRPSTSATSTFTNMTFKMGHTTLTAFVSGPFNSGLQTVYTAPSVTITTTSGVWLAFTLTTPFSYDNTQNLIVEGTQTAYTGSGFSLNQDGTLPTRRMYGSLVSGTGTAGTGLADFGFDIITCQGPTGVVASNVTVNGVTMNWNTVPASLGYERVLDQNPSSPTGAGTFTSVNTYTTTGLTLNTTYYFHIRNICSNGYSQWGNYSFTTLNAYCLPPNNILFTNITETSVDLLWSKMPTSDSYEYKVDLTPNAPLNSNNTIKTAGITAYVGGLQPNTKYYVYVRSICLGGSDSSYWKKDSFITKSFCGVPEVTVTDAGTNNPSASWPAVPSAIAYEYAITGNTADPAFGTEIYTTNLNLTLDQDGKDKYLHVRSKCNSQFLFSQWATNPLRVTPSAIKQVQDLDGVAVYPNPVKDRFVIRTEDGISGSYILTDVTGRVMQRGELAKNVMVDMSGYATGTYALKYIIDSKAAVIKLVKD